MYVYTSNSERITLYDSPLASGGEGEIHKVKEAPIRFVNICVKIYYQKKRNLQLEQKIKYMVANPPPKIGGTRYRIGWPIDWITDEKKHFLGFIMQLAYINSEQLIKLTTPKLSKKLSDEWITKYDRTNGVPALISRLKLLHNISIPLHLLHSTNRYILRDLKPENILVTPKGSVTLVDLDSIQITDPNKHQLLYPGTTATPNYIPPEYYSKGTGKNTTDVIDKSWDYFAIGVIYYQILMGLHPYVVTPYEVDDNCNAIATNIAKNLFPFGNNKRLIRDYPDLHNRFKKLHPDLQKLFLNAFSSETSIRPSAYDWGQCLHDLLVPNEQQQNTDEEAKRRAVEEKARRKAEEARRRAAEEEARRKAEETKRRAAEEEARRKAEEARRRAAEEEARRKAEETKRRAAEEEARKKSHKTKLTLVTISSIFSLIGILLYFIFRHKIKDPEYIIISAMLSLAIKLIIFLIFFFENMYITI